ncbi:MAG: hypothetical protein EBR82_39035 [Caulobacteraceae bacterium]|nr:hypothetical protein [Caulobacteraceae bacterium]
MSTVENAPQTETAEDTEWNRRLEKIFEASKRREAELDAEFKATLPKIGNPPICRPCLIHPDSMLSIHKGATVKQQRAVYCTKCDACDHEEKVVGYSYRNWIRRGLPKLNFGVTMDRLDLNPNDRAAFDDFLNAGSGFLVLLGSMGAGKTIAACALLQKFGRGHYTTRGELVSKFRGGYAAARGEETADDVAETYYQTPLLVLDEFEKADEGRDASALLFRIIDSRYRNMLPTIICGNATLKDFKRIVGDLGFSRISGAGSSLIEFAGVDRRTTKEAGEFYKRQVALTRRLDQLVPLEDSI